MPTSTSKIRNLAPKTWSQLPSLSSKERVTGITWTMRTICLSQLFTAAISRPLQQSLSLRESLRKLLRSSPRRRARVRDTSFALLWPLLAHITSETPLKFHLSWRTLTLRNLKRSKSLLQSAKLRGHQGHDQARKSRSCASQTAVLRPVWPNNQIKSQLQREKKNRCCHQWPWKLSKSQCSMT